MKQIKTLLIAAMVVLGANTMNAQAKVAHVNVAEIMTKMPAMLDAQKQLEKLSTTYDAEYKKMVTEYQDLLKKYDAEAKTVTDAVNETRGKEVQDMQKRIVDYRDNAQKELQQKEADIVKPIMEKVKAKKLTLDGWHYIIETGEVFRYDCKEARFILANG